MKQLSTVLILILLFGTVAGGESAPRLDPALRALLADRATAQSGVFSAAQDPTRVLPVPRSLLSAATSDAFPDRLEVFLEGSGIVSGPGIDAVPLGGDIVGARVTLEALARLIEEGRVESARLSRAVRPALDLSSEYLGLRRVRSEVADTGEFSGYTGRGVVVGIVDSGLDATHPDFLNEDGTSRVSWYWDQTSLGTAPPGYGFGTEFRGFNIDNGFFRGQDRTGHGTHVAGIAAGNGRASFLAGQGSRYTGIAPEAELMIVRTNFTEFGVATAVRWVFERADQMGLPAVVNLSLGSHSGPHAGDGPFERSVGDLVGPSRLVVTAAGNDAARSYHSELSLLPGESTLMRVNVPVYVPSTQAASFVQIEGWGDVRNRYRVRIHDLEGALVGELTFGDERIRFEHPQAIITGWYTEDRGRASIVVDIADNYLTPRRATGAWRVEFEALEIAGDPDLDFWMVNWFLPESDESPRFLDHVDPEETVLVPGTAEEVITVGAVATRDCWPRADGSGCYSNPPELGEVAYFSAIGPTATGVAKPEVLAPGFGVVSALAGTIREEFWTAEALAPRTIPGGRYWVNQGTSMAAPHVTGTIALLMEKYGGLTPEQARARLTARAEPLLDPRTGRVENRLRVGETLAPVVDLALSEFVREPDGNRIRWFVGKARAEVGFKVYKGFSEDGPFFELGGDAIEGNNPFEVVDRNLEAGREHIYRIAAVDAHGLEDVLAQLSTPVEGTPRLTLRAPDPNPARGPVNLRFFLPASPAGGRYTVDILSAAGRHVRRVAEARFEPDGAEILVQWDLTGLGGRRVPAGVYFARVGYLPDGSAGAPESGVRVRRMVVLP